MSSRDSPTCNPTGNNRQVCFASEQDFAAYANWLKDYSKKYQVDIHAWVLMTNHVHLVCTPHPLYLALGSEPIERQSNYRELFKYHVEGKLLEDIRFAANKGMVLGNGCFEAEAESLTGRRMTRKKDGATSWLEEEKVDKLFKFTLTPVIF